MSCDAHRGCALPLPLAQRHTFGWVAFVRPKCSARYSPQVLPLWPARLIAAWKRLRSAGPQATVGSERLATTRIVHAHEMQDKVAVAYENTRMSMIACVIRAGETSLSPGITHKLVESGRHAVMFDGLPEYGLSRLPSVRNNAVSAGEAGRWL